MRAPSRGHRSPTVSLLSNRACGPPLRRRPQNVRKRRNLYYQRSNPHRGTRTFRGRQIGITQATTVYREGGLSYAATAHPPFCDAGSLPADYRARSAELERRAGQTSLLRPDRKPGIRSRYPRALGGPDRACSRGQALERGQRHQGLLSERRLRWLSASHLHTIVHKFKVCKRATRCVWICASWSAGTSPACVG
jgi:hypothetical protein